MSFTSRAGRRGLGLAAGLMLLPLVANAAWAEAQTFSVYFAAREFTAAPTAVRLVGAIKGLIKKTSRVTITGYCDTAEADADKLSLARAAEVHGILLGLGVPAGAKLTVTAKGAADPRVPTGPNVAEPQNRRVEVKIE